MAAGATYDVVIVGAGSAGCALAYRLSSDPAVSVALIEAGGSDQRDNIRVPSRFFANWDTDVDWGYRSTPQPGTDDRVHKLPRGKVLGGTSSINGMIWLRGAASDYDRWAAAGCAGWEWARVRAAFDELETLLRPAALDPLNELSQAMVEAAVQAGFPRSSTFDAGTLDGAGWNKSSIAGGERMSAYRAFIAPVFGRPNLHILANTRALRIAFEGTRATGVVAKAGQGPAETIAAGEVILCAGAFDSPRLLLLSGIGPAAELERFDIAPVTDLPVGENLIDHLLIGVVFDSRRPISELNAYCTEGCLFTRSAPDLPDCDLEISFATKPHFAPDVNDGRPRFTIIPGIVRPRSRGWVRLTAADPDAPLAIDPNYFADPADMRAMIAAVRISRRIAAQPALAEWNGGEHFPGTGVESDEAIAAYVARGVSTWFHPVGTCRMGVGAGAVVDPTLRVHGIAGLRVADASIMPEIVSVNTNAASIMIGWHAADVAGIGS